LQQKFDNSKKTCFCYEAQLSVSKIQLAEEKVAENNRPASHQQKRKKRQARMDIHTSKRRKEDRYGKLADGHPRRTGCRNGP